MKKNFAIASVLSAFFLFVLLPVAAESQPLHRPGLMGMGQGLKEILDLTPEQEAKLDELQKARLGKAEAFREEMKKLHEELQGLMRDEKADLKKADGLVDSIHKLQAEHMKANLRFRLDTEKILTPEQREKLKKFQDRLERFRQLRQGRSGRFFGPGMRQGPGGMGRGLGRGMRRPGMGRGMWWIR